MVPFVASLLGSIQWVVQSDTDFLIPTECSKIQFNYDTKVPGARVRSHELKLKVPNKTALTLRASLKWGSLAIHTSAQLTKTLEFPTIPSGSIIL